MDYSITLRVARLVWLLARNGGRWVTTAEVAQQLEMSPGGTWEMLNRIERAQYIPLVAQRTRRGQATLWRIEPTNTPSGSGATAGVGFPTPHKPKHAQR